MTNFCTELASNLHQDGFISPLLTCSHGILVFADSASIRLMIFFISFLADAVDLCLCAPQTAVTETCFDSHRRVLLGATLESALTAVLYKTAILIRCSGSSFRTILANQNIFFFHPTPLHLSSCILATLDYSRRNFDFHRFLFAYLHSSDMLKQLTSGPGCNYSPL